MTHGHQPSEILPNWNAFVDDEGDVLPVADLDTDSTDTVEPNPRAAELLSLKRWAIDSANAYDVIASEKSNRSKVSKDARHTLGRVKQEFLEFYGFPSQLGANPTSAEIDHYERGLTHYREFRDELHDPTRRDELLVMIDHSLGIYTRAA